MGGVRVESKKQSKRTKAITLSSEAGSYILTSQQPERKKKYCHSKRTAVPEEASHVKAFNPSS
jgi:hypothetical protein